MRPATEGPARCCAPDRLARPTIAVMDGLQLQWLLDPESVDMAADFRAYVDDLVSSLCAPS